MAGFKGLRPPAAGTPKASRLVEPLDHRPSELLVLGGSGLGALVLSLLASLSVWLRYASMMLLFVARSALSALALSGSGRSCGFWASWLVG